MRLRKEMIEYISKRIVESLVKRKMIETEIETEKIEGKRT